MKGVNDFFHIYMSFMTCIVGSIPKKLGSQFAIIDCQVPQEFRFALCFFCVQELLRSLLSLIGRSHTNLVCLMLFFFSCLNESAGTVRRYLHQKVLFGHITSLSIRGPHHTYVGARVNILPCVGGFRSMVSPNKELWRLNLTQSKTKSKFSSLVGLGCPNHLVEAKSHNACADTRLRAEV